MEGNDYDVFYYPAASVWRGEARIYEVESLKGRSFLYPPAAGVLLAPLAAMPRAASIVLFLLAKMGALIALAAAAWTLRPATAGTAHRGVFYALLAGILSRPLTSDFANGQINLILAFLAVGGAWWLLQPGVRGLLGAAPLSLAIATKLTPAALLVVPFLHRRVVGLLLSLGLVAVFSLGLPYLWYGADDAAQLHWQYGDVSEGLFLSAKQRDTQRSVYELIVFSVANARAPEGLILSKGRLSSVNDAGVPQRLELPDPFPISLAHRLWLWTALALGMLFIVARALKFGHGPRDPAWDLAFLCAILPIASPLARKAHFVIMILPVGLVLREFLARCQASGSPRGMFHRHPIFLLAFMGMAFLFLIGDSLAIPIPWASPMPLRPGMLMAGLAAMAALVALPTERL